jgi:hypothetical protein
MSYFVNHHCSKHLSEFNLIVQNDPFGYRINKNIEILTVNFYYSVPVTHFPQTQKTVVPFWFMLLGLNKPNTDRRDKVDNGNPVLLMLRSAHLV